MSPRRADPKQKAQSSSGLPNWVIAVGVGVVVVLAAFGLYMLQSSASSQPVNVAVGDTATSASRTLGDLNAKVKLVEYSDFQ